MIEKQPVIAITGSSGYIGSRFLRKLEDEDSIGGLVAIDLKPLPTPIHNVSQHTLDISKSVNSVFQNSPINSVVHLAFDPRIAKNKLESKKIADCNLKGLKNILDKCRSYHVKNFLYLSSHTVYGAYHDNPVPITENVAPRPLPGFTYSETKLQSEEIVQKFAVDNPTTTVTILRCSMVIGPGDDNFVTKALLKPILLGVMGSDPPLQFIHEDDLSNLLVHVTLNPIPGIFNVAGKGIIRYSKLASILERKLISLPSFIAYRLVQTAWKTGMQKESPSIGLNLVRYPVILSTGKIRAVSGFQFRYTAEEAATSFVTANVS